jgi:hypothetical protein
MVFLITPRMRYPQTAKTGLTGHFLSR